MNATVILAEAGPWTYVTGAYVVTYGTLGIYAASVIRRGRKINRQLPPDERRWSR